MSQTTLFGGQNHAKENKNALPGKVKWSYSKRSILDSCLRRYFYQYYDESNENSSTLSIPSLKRLASKEAVFGNIIHWIIACSLRSAQKGTEWDDERIISFGQKMVEDTISRSKQFSTIKKFNLNENFFQEIVFGEENSDRLRDEAFERIETCIDNLFETQEFYKIYEAGKIDYSLIEKNTNFKLTDSVTIYGQLDIAYYDGPGVRIIDWKTGEETIEDSSLQLSVYALWANIVEKFSSENIEISKAYLYDDSYVNLVFNSTELQRAQARILQDSCKMDELEGFAKTGIIEAFDMCESMKVCNKCSFKRLCYEA
jgi:hypothetical protein